MMEPEVRGSTGMIPFGEMPDGRLVDVTSVPSGLACGAICPECRSRLVARKGDVNRHHFAHFSQTECSGGFETAIHQMAKQIVSDAKSLKLPDVVARYRGRTNHLFDNVTPKFSRVELEVWMDGIRPDAVAFIGERPLAIEFLVTHGCEPAKLEIFRNRRMPAIEIDLSQVGRDVSLSQLRSKVLRSAPRIWLFNPKAADAEVEMARVEADLEKRRLREQRRREMEQARIAAAEAVRLAELERKQAEARAARVVEYAEERAKAKARQDAVDRADAARAVILEAERVQKIAAIKREMSQYATAMLGLEAAALWMSKPIRLHDGSVLRAPDLMTDTRTEEFYWEHLKQKIKRMDEVDARATSARQNVQRKAEAHFRNNDRADLWMKAHHPRLGMKSPAEVSIEPGGVERCLIVLASAKT